MLGKSVSSKLIDPDALYGISEKLDGVPATISWDESGMNVKAVSRQDKPILSINHILKQMQQLLDISDDTEISGELYIKGKPFKDIGGLVRKQETNENTEQLEFWIFPEFADKLDLDDLHDGADRRYPHINIIPQDTMTGNHIICQIKDGKWKPSQHFHDFYENERINSENDPFFEGYIARKVGTPWLKGKRSNDYLKLIEDPTLDLKVIGFNEAEDKEGKALGRVGSFICEWGKGETCNVGAGKLSHSEAKFIWNRHIEQPQLLDYSDLIIEVKYKRDPSYTVPRQPTFQSWRDDKDEYDLEM